MPRASRASDGRPRSEAILNERQCFNTHRPQGPGAIVVKHGIDFLEAQALGSDPDRIEGPGRSTDEPRFQIVGQIGDNVDRDGDISP